MIFENDIQNNCIYVKYKSDYTLVQFEMKKNLSTFYVELAWLKHSAAEVYQRLVDRDKCVVLTG